MRYVTLFDTSVATDNIGDEIIMDSVEREARAILPDDFFIRVPTHEIIGAVGRNYARNSYISLVGGTNLLRRHWWFRGQWKVGFLDAWRIGRPVLMGVGWRNYQKKTDIPTAWMLKRMLSEKHVHSVRDEYTKQKLAEIGIQNVVNTGCPTMWNLTEQKCQEIPVNRARNALITVTAYSYNPALDRKWIELVLAKYEKVYFWSQMFDDLAYARAIAGNRLIVVGPGLREYDRLIEENDLDYIGTRLHGGIRVLQKGRRALIIKIDNRATEIARDTNLPVVDRDNIDSISRWIEGSDTLKISMPWKTIEQWKKQFL